MKFHKTAVFLLSIFLTAAAYGGLIQISGPRHFVSAAGDTTPSPFSLVDQTNVATSTVVTSDGVTITDIDTAITCSVSGGTSPGIDVGADGNWQTSRSVSNGDSIRVRHTSSASNSTATNTVADCNGVSDTFTSTTEAGGASGAFFEPDVDAATTLTQIFPGPNGNDGINNHDGGTTQLITDPNPRPGTTKSVCLTYPSDEAGSQWMPAPFPATPTLFIRKYVKFSSAWTGNWPVGLKTSRYFTRDDWTTGDPIENNAWSYVSEKLVWQSYAGDPDDDYGRGVGYSIFVYEPEPSSQFTSGQLFANGLPYYRTDTWYKWETWIQLNSADGVADGIVRIWVDDVLVHERTDLPFVETARGIPNGSAGFQTMWFGGNYSGADFGGPSETLTRCENGFLLSTTDDHLTE